MKIATWNVNGIRARQFQAHEWIEQARPDVLCLQEIKAAPEQLPSTLRELENYWCCWHGEKGYSGVGLHVRKDVLSDQPVFENPDFDFECRAVTVRLGALTIASIYVPNGGKDFDAKLRFLSQMGEWASGFLAEGSPLIVCGDLNVTRCDIDVHPKGRKKTAIGQRPEERMLFEKLLSRRLVDVGRTLDPNNDRLFTWWAPWRNHRQRNIGWRIDYILVSEMLRHLIVDCAVFRNIGTSDHAPVVATFDLAGNNISPQCD